MRGRGSAPGLSYGQRGEEQEGKGFPVSQAFREIKTERRENGRLAQALQNFGRMAARYALECQLFEGLHSQLHFPVFTWKICESRNRKSSLSVPPLFRTARNNGLHYAAELSEAKSS